MKMHLFVELLPLAGESEEVANLKIAGGDVEGTGNLVKDTEYLHKGEFMLVL